ncbi:hypothetical protein K9M78_03075 [Candidatus Bipolaricaulota bacterium]|nr:hypothetical protein [Candidatus Bipolaricaulota bacterium]
MLSKNFKITSVLSLVLVLGLMVTSFVGFAGNGFGSEGERILKETYIDLLAPKLGLETENLDALMDKAMNQAVAEDERPIGDNYLEILVAEVADMDVEKLKTTMVETKAEAADKLAAEGAISEELANTFKERASTFPFGYSNQGAEKGKSQRSSPGKAQNRDGNQYGAADGTGSALQPEDGTGYGPGAGRANDGTCDGGGPHGRQAGDDEERGSRNGGRRKN